MKNISREALESERPFLDAITSINFCLEQLYKDNRHDYDDELVNNLTFEELIGALLLAQDGLTSLKEEDSSLYDAIYGNY